MALRELTCIVCPAGCSLTVADPALAVPALAGPALAGKPPDISVTGNRCPRGEVYAREEMTDPKRTVTATCAVNNGGVLKRVPVKSSAPCPKEKIFALLSDIYQTKINLPVKTGDLIIENWKGCGINVVAARTVE